MSLPLLLATKTLDLPQLDLGRRFVTPLDGLVVEATQVNPERLVLSHEGIHIDSLSHLKAGGANGFIMHHDVVEFATDRNVTEGANVHISSPAAVKSARLEPPQDMSILRVEGLDVTVNLIVFYLLHSNIQA
jgi:hypothetical protein